MKYLKLINEEFPTPRKSYSVSELEEKIKDLEEQIENCDVISHEAFDFKEIDADAIQKWKKSVEELGGYLTMDPSYEDSDEYGFYISKKPIDKSLLKQLMKFNDELDES
jgi:hypothetical protein